MTREVQEAVARTAQALASSEGAASLARDNQLGAILNNPAQRREYEAALREQNLLGPLVIDYTGQRRSAIDNQGNGNGNVDRTELQRDIQNQRSRGASGDRLAIFTDQIALRAMQQNQRTELTTGDLQRPYANLQPEAARLRQAADEYAGIRDRMQQMDPRNVENGRISIGSLRAALENSPERFTPAQREAARTMLNPTNIDALASDNTAYGGRWLANMWRGNDSRYLNPTYLEERAAAFGAPANPAEQQAAQARRDLEQRFNAARGEISNPGTPGSPGSNPAETGPRPAGTPRNYEPSSDSNYSEYTIRAGDTMWHLAREFMQVNNPNGEAPTNQQIDRFYRAIARENQISNPNNVPVGRRLRIPNEYQQLINPGSQPN